ncbi:MAG: hypothetical protein WC786_03885 [Patescibacteria group bacterium]
MQQLHLVKNEQLTDNEWLAYLKKHPQLLGFLAQADRSRVVTKAILSLNAGVVTEQLGKGTTGELALKLIEAARQFAVWIVVSARTFGWPIQDVTPRGETKKPPTPQAMPPAPSKESKTLVGNLKTFCDAVGGEAAARKIISDMYAKKGSQGKAALALSRKYPKLLKRKNAQRTLSNWMKFLSIPVDNTNQSPKRHHSKRDVAKTAAYPFATGKLKDANDITLEKRGMTLANLILKLKKTYSWPDLQRVILELTGKNVHQSQLSRLYRWGKKHQLKKRG